MAKRIATTQMGITVFCLYPTPNCLKPPSGVYNNAGFRECIIENASKKINTAIDSLCTLTKLLLMYILHNYEIVFVVFAVKLRKKRR